jgi:hypothetical protein
MIGRNSFRRSLSRNVGAPVIPAEHRKIEARTTRLEPSNTTFPPRLDALRDRPVRGMRPKALDDRAGEELVAVSQTHWGFAPAPEITFTDSSLCVITPNVAPRAGGGSRGVFMDVTSR